MNKLRMLYKKHWLVRWFWWLAVIIPGVPFVLISVGFLLFMHWPRDYQAVVNLPFDTNAEYLTLSAHGVKDTPASWSDALQSTFSDSKHLSFSRLKKQHISLSWQPYSDSVLICSVAGKSIGYELGEKIGKMPNLQAVHLIGHSCGSFVIFGLCESLKQQDSSISVQTTYLDPVSIYSGVFWDYGLDHFGRCADFSDAYIDTEDTVPGSNQALPYAYTFDVTKTRTGNNLDYAPHQWPTIFYLNALKENQLPIYYKSTAQMSKNFQKNILMKWLESNINELNYSH